MQEANNLYYSTKYFPSQEQLGNLCFCEVITDVVFDKNLQKNVKCPQKYLDVYDDEICDETDTLYPKITPKYPIFYGDFDLPENSTDYLDTAQFGIIFRLEDRDKIYEKLYVKNECRKRMFGTLYPLSNEELIQNISHADFSYADLQWLIMFRRHIFYGEKYPEVERYVEIYRSTHPSLVEFEILDCETEKDLSDILQRLGRSYWRIEAYNGENMSSFLKNKFACKGNLLETLINFEKTNPK